MSRFVFRRRTTAHISRRELSHEIAMHLGRIVQRQDSLERMRTHFIRIIPNNEDRTLLIAQGKYIFQRLTENESNENSSHGGSRQSANGNTDNGSTLEKFTCKVCFFGTVSLVGVKCGHLICTHCYVKLKKVTKHSRCPFCRCHFVARKMFFS